MKKRTYLVFTLIFGLLVVVAMPPTIYGLSDKESHELVELRTPNSKTYFMGGGTYRSVHYMKPIHYEKDGRMVEIDNSISTVQTQNAVDKDLPYQNKRNRYRVGFAQNSQNEKVLRFQRGKYTIELDLLKDVKPTVAEYKGNQITYPDVYQNVDLIFYTGSNGVKKEWKIDRYNGQEKFSFRIDTQALKPEMQSDGSIHFLNSNGDLIIKASRPSMIDKNLRYSDGAKYKLRKENSVTYLDLILDESWLKDKKRSYPVSVDQVFELQAESTNQDAFVGSLNDTEKSRNYGSATYMTVGNNPDHGISRSFLQFDLNSLIGIKGAKISSARLHLWQTNISSTTEKENIHPVTKSWNEGTITWNNQPTVGDVLTTENATDAGWYEFDLTSLVRQWYNGETANYGISVRHQDESKNRKSYFSSEYLNNTSKRPKLIVDYALDGIEYKGKVNEFRTHRYQLSTTGTGTVNVVANYENSSVNYLLYQEEPEFKEFVNGDELPAGKYYFEVNTTSSKDVSYSYHLTGLPGIENNISTLPTLTVSEPSQHIPRLSKGTSSTKFSGTTNGENAFLTKGIDAPISLTSVFSKTVGLTEGPNVVTLNAMKKSNEVLDFYNPISPGVKRLDGRTPAEVSVSVSKEISSLGYKPKTVLLTSDQAWVHGLSAAPLAAQEKAPILLTDPTTLSTVTKSEIQRIAPEKVIIIGGPGSVSDEIEANELPALGVENIERIWGTTRYDTPPLIAERVVNSDNNSETTGAFIATGENFEDALSHASLAGNMGLPILLVKTSSIPDATRNFLKRNPRIETLYVVGKTGSIDDSVITTLNKYGNVEDLRGASRYNGNVNSLYHFWLRPDHVTVTHGWTFQGMLTSSSLTAIQGGVTVISNKTSLSDPVMVYLYDNKDNPLNYMYIPGGTDSISSELENDLDQYIPD